MEDTGARLALGPVRLAGTLEAILRGEAEGDCEGDGDGGGGAVAGGDEAESEDEKDSDHEEELELGGFGGFAGTMDGGSVAAPLSPPALRSLSAADGGVAPEQAGGEQMVTDEQRAAMLLLQDPVYRECAARLEKLRAVHHKAKDALSKAKAAGPTPSPSGELREDVQGQLLQAQRLRRLEMLEKQLELALQNQRRYLLGRAGIEHLADGMVHLQGLGRLNESSAWVPPGGGAALASPRRAGDLATTCGIELNENEVTPASLAAGISEPTPRGIGAVPTGLEVPPSLLQATQMPNMDGAAALETGDLRMDLMGVNHAEDKEWTVRTENVGAAGQRDSPPLPEIHQAADELKQESLSEHSPTASEIEACSFGDHVTNKPDQHHPGDGSSSNCGGGEHMATAERDAMGAQLLEQLQRMEAQHLDSTEYSQVPRGATLIIEAKQQKGHKQQPSGAQPAQDGERDGQQDQGRHKCEGNNNKRRNKRLRPLRRTRASALEERSGLNATPSRVRLARNKEVTKRRAIEEAGLDRFGAMQQAGFNTMLRRPVARADAIATDLLANEEAARQCKHTNMDSEKSRLDAAVGNDAELEDTLAHVQMPHPPLQLKRVDGRQGPRRAKALGSKNHNFMAIRERGNARQPLLPQLLSGDAEMESKPEEVLPAGGRHIAERMHTRHNVTERENQRQAALQKQAKRSQAGDELAEEMEALQRARLSRQVTEDRIAKKHMPGLRYSKPVPNAAAVRDGIDQRIRQLQRQAVPAEPTEASLRRQLRAQQPGRRDKSRAGVAAVLRSARAEARAEVASRTPFAQVHLPQRRIRGSEIQNNPKTRKAIASSSKVPIPNISDLIAQRLAAAREAAVAEILGDVTS